MITAIVSNHNNWYCKDCNNSHRILYINAEKKYCKKCFPENLKNEEIQYINQNRQILEGFKEE